LSFNLTLCLDDRQVILPVEGAGGEVLLAGGKVYDIKHTCIIIK